MFPSKVPDQVRIPGRDAAPIGSGGRARLLAPLARLTLCCFLGAFAAPAQDDDAVTVYTTSALGILPNGGDNTAALQAAFAALVSNDTFIFDVPGTYRVTGLPGSGPILSLSNKSGVTIEAVAGVKILLTGYDRSVQNLPYPNVLSVQGCSDFTLRGASPGSPLVFDTEGASTGTPTVHGLPFLQGTLVSKTPGLVAVDGTPQPNELRIAVTDGEMFLPTNCTAAVWSSWESVANQAPRLPTYHGVAIPAGPAAVVNGVLTQFVDIQFEAQPYWLPFKDWTVGNQVVATLNNSDSYTVILNACGGNSIVENLLAHHLPGKFCTAAQMDGLVVRNVVARPPSAARRLSVNRDGLNAGGVSLLVEDCHMDLVGDDGIVAQGSAWGRVVPGSCVLTVPTPGGPPAGLWRVTLEPPTTVGKWPALARPGHLVAFLDGATLSPAGADWGVVHSYTVVTLPSNARQVTYTFSATSPNLPTRLLNTTVAAPTVAYNPMYSAMGGLVRNCTVTGPRGIGIVVRSLNTTVDFCTITDTLECGIHAGGGFVDAYPWWGAGAPPHNLVVKRCTLTRCGFGGGTLTNGAIEIAVAQSGQKLTGPCIWGWVPIYASTPDVIQNVTLDDNTIVDYPRAGIFAANVGGTNGITITNNTFVNAGAFNSCHPEYGHCVALQSCGSGLIQSNTYTNYVGKYCRTRAATWSGCPESRLTRGARRESARRAYVATGGTATSDAGRLRSRRSAVLPKTNRASADRRPRMPTTTRRAPTRRA